MFPTLPKLNFKFSSKFILSSANAFTLDQSKILLSGNGLKGIQPFKLHLCDNIQEWTNHSKQSDFLWSNNPPITKTKQLVTENMNIVTRHCNN